MNHFITGFGVPLGLPSLGYYICFSDPILIFCAVNQILIACICCLSYKHTSFVILGVSPLIVFYFLLVLQLIMSPGLICDPPVFHPQDGHALENLSDRIDAVNILKACLKEKDLYEDSQFDKEKDKSQFRQYEEACDHVKAFYREQHTKQTVAYNLEARQAFHSKTRADMTIWEAMEKLNTLIDESDPDTSLSQIEHLLQSAEAIRRDGKPRWMQLTGLIHDLGKLLYFFGAEGQWDVVGDTFPVGCAFDDRIIYGQESFKDNPDYGHEIYRTKFGIYSPRCGLDNIMLSWGHDEYLYHVVKDQSTLPPEALAMIRYHSFYPWHAAGAYHEFMGDRDQEMLQAVKAFNPYDLYSKSDDIPKVEELKVSSLPWNGISHTVEIVIICSQPYYLELIDEYFPNKVIKW